MSSPIPSDPLLVEAFTATVLAAAEPLRYHLEFISIRHGSGVHVVNGQRFDYLAGDVFFLSPTDTYSFEIDYSTRFGVLRFTEAYLTELATAAGAALSAYELHAALGGRGSLATAATEPRLGALFDLLFAEHESRETGFNEALTAVLLGAVLRVLEQQIPAPPVAAGPGPSHPAACVQRLLAYIRHHIQEPERLRLARLATDFHYSPGHLSALFRQEVGESLRQFIIGYKLTLVEARLHLSTRTVSQISDDLGFTDVCHLNKLFKKRYHTTPTDYRRHRWAAA